MGSARNVLPDARDESDFNSRSLPGERYHVSLNNKQPCLFQFSLPAWERYQEGNIILFDLKISILVPCMGSDF